MRLNRVDQFEYHTFLHHSQTPAGIYSQTHPFEYPTFLHHSQTFPSVASSF